MRTRNTLYLFLALVVAISLAGCAKASTNTAQAAGQNGAQAPQIPEISRLALGVLTLEDTDQAVTAEQAKTMLPLWRAYRLVDGSQSAAPQERDALVKQIRAALTDEQRSAIEALQLTPDTWAEALERAGVNLQASPQGMDPSALATRVAQRGTGGGTGARGGQGGGPGGGFPGGAMPPGGVMIAPGGGGAQGGEALSAQAVETLRAQRSAAGGGGGLMGSTMLIERVIQVLASKA